MYEVSVKGSFSAAHSLIEIGGKCEKLHGHNFTVEVVITSHRLNDQGVVIDFRILKSFLSDILGILDHSFLNEIDPFAESNPSSEHIAYFIHSEMEKKIRQEGIDARVRINVWESDTSRASYWEGER